MMDQDIDEGDYAFSFNYQPTSPAEKNITKSIDKGKIPERPPVQYASNDINDLLTQFSVEKKNECCCCYRKSIKLTGTDFNKSK